MLRVAAAWVTMRDLTLFSARWASEVRLRVSLPSACCMRCSYSSAHARGGVGRRRGVHACSAQDHFRTIDAWPSLHHIGSYRPAGQWRCHTLVTLSHV